MYVDLQSVAAVDNIFSGGGSVAMWLVTDSLAAQVAQAGAGTSTANGGDGWAFLISAGGKLVLRQAWSTNRGVWVVNSAHTIAAGKWHHVVVTYDSDSDANNASFFQDGQVTTANKSATPSGTVADDSGLDKYVGRGANGGTMTYFDGRISDVRFFNREITAAEASWLGAGYKGPIDGEVAWHGFEQVLTIPDLSPNDNVPVDTNSPSQGPGKAGNMGVII